MRRRLFSTASPAAGANSSHVTDGIPDNDRDSYAKGAPIPNLVGPAVNFSGSVND